MSKEKYDITDNELKDFFNKYNLIELESFNLIFEYCYDYDITDVLKIARIVYNEKYNSCADEFETPIRHMTFKTSDIKEKNNLLNDKELKFLYDLTESAVMCLESIKHFDVEAEIIDLSKLDDSISTEIENRKNSKKVKSKKR